MNNSYSAIQPNAGWWRLLWAEDCRHELAVQLALSCLKDIPGCSLGPKGLDVPHTAWMLAPFEELVELCNVRLPRLPQNVYAEWSPQRSLYPYQVEGVQFILAERGVLLADEMGLGKTYQAAVAAEQLRQARGGVGFILAPLMVRDNWRQELLAIGAIEHDSQFCALVSKNIDDASFRTQDVRYYFVHYDVADAWWSRLVSIDSTQRAVAILDEAHWIRNPRNKRSKAAGVVGGTCRNRILLTGTPLDNRPSDLWFPLTVAAGTRTWGSMLDFRKRYCGAQYNGYGWEDTVATQVNELRERIEPFFLRRTAVGVGLQLPSLTRTAHHVSLDLTAQARHDAILKGVSLETLVRALVSGVVDDVLPILTGLRQVTSRAKVRATADLACNVLDQGQPLVVSCWEPKIAERILRAIDAPLNRKFLITGEIDQSVRAESIARFQAVPAGDVAVLVSTLGAMREGVTLHRARTILLHDLSWVMNHLLQVEKRIHRIGQTWPCQSIWVLAQNSIDTIMAPILMRKAQYAAEVLGIEAGVDAVDELELGAFDEPLLVEQQLERAMRLWKET